MNEVATKRPAPLVEFKHNLQRLIDAKELALPSNVSMDAFRNAAIVAVQDNPTILTCNPESVFKAIRKLAGAGLVPDGQEAAIVPFKGQAQAMPMVRGLRKIARNSGEIASLWDEVVYEGEILTITVDDGERRFQHKQADGSPLDALTRGGDVVGAYAVAKLKDGTVEFLSMNKKAIEKRRMASASQRGKSNPDGVWRDWYEEMARKTVVRGLCNKLPMSAEDVRRIMEEDDANAVQLRDITPADEAPAPRRNLAQRLADPELPASEPEILPPEGSQDLDLSAAFPGSDEWDEGVKAFQAGDPEDACPYDTDNEKITNWIGGYRAAAQAQENVE